MLCRSCVHAGAWEPWRGPRRAPMPRHRWRERWIPAHTEATAASLFASGLALQPGCGRRAQDGRLGCAVAAAGARLARGGVGPPQGGPRRVAVRGGGAPLAWRECDSDMCGLGSSFACCAAVASQQVARRPRPSPRLGTPAAGRPFACACCGRDARAGLVLGRVALLRRIARTTARCGARRCPVSRRCGAGTCSWGAPMRQSWRQPALWRWAGRPPQGPRVPGWGSERALCSAP